MPFLKDASPSSSKFSSGSVARFTKDEFDEHIDELGDNIVHYKSVKAPSFDYGDSLFTDTNTRGGHYIWINPVDIRGIAQSASQEFVYQLDGELVTNQIMVTFSREDRIGKMDKLVFRDSSFEYTESIDPFIDGNGYKAYTTYPVKSMYVLFKYDGDENRYKRLEEGVDFTVEENIISFDETLYPSTTDKNLMGCGIRYSAVPVYYVTNFLHLIRSIKNDALQFQQMPVQVMAKIAHDVLDRESITGDYYNDNSFAINECKEEDKAKFIKGDGVSSSLPLLPNFGDLETL